MQLKSLSIYRLTLLVLMFVAFRGFWHAFTINYSFHEFHIPALALGLAISSLPALIHSFTTGTNKSSRKGFLQFIMVISGCFSWIPLVLNTMNWGFMAFLNFGVGLVILSNTEIRHDKSSSYFIYGNLGLQLFIFGAFLPIISNEPITNQANTTIFNTSGSWITLSVIYVASGLLNLLELQRKENILQTMTKTSALKDHLHLIYNHNLKTPLQTILMQAKMMNIKYGQDYSTVIIEKNAEEIRQRIFQLMEIEQLNGRLDDFSNQNLSKILKSKYDGEIEVYDNIDHLEIKINQILQLALENFLDNAIKFADTKPILYLNEYYGGIHIRIIDDGPGMNADQIVAYGNPTKSRSNGSGLGVYLSIELLNEANYQVKVSSSPGNGTKIDIYQNARFNQLTETTEMEKLFI